MAVVPARHFASVLGPLVMAALLSPLLLARAEAQVAPAIAKSFEPATATLFQDVLLTVTVSNPNAAVPLTNVQFSDTMPAGIDLITQVGGTCSTPATGGGMFTINPGTEFFASTSTVLAGGQSCTIVVRVRGTAVGQFVNTTSPVAAPPAPIGAAATATLTVLGAPVLQPLAIPTLDPRLLALLAVLLWLMSRGALAPRDSGSAS